MRHNEGKKGRSFSGKKALPVFLICLAVLLGLDLLLHRWLCTRGTARFAALH